ncbi:TetR/AcrR family transcriptional regulator C-terminal domain-containing protein [Streptomyces sp. LX-29]|uniref:TetR/AcrR family transcriptional regulator C-terminal domain-containing protein n=1 Tax=Streptomyces sp. LX-29 TaxID=2900152 RepID=UPI00240E596B|nr:TetR/AcrR family transcriptional regulator C-terminal domain-containing protein [Streptomyces sp. LX-29]WFB05898.1 TetR/AcrR family transcriptional regulator C-terminal domain-containing protein [Streptomyces sp. LX-29]
MKINSELIARTSLRLLNDAGLDGLTMRLIAQELGVRAPTLYWHIKNKQQLLDAMATLVYVEAAERLEPPRGDLDWADRLADWARHLRRVMLNYRDGARVLAGTYVNHPAVQGVSEQNLRTLLDAGFTLGEAAHGFTAVLHYTIGYTIEEQAHSSAAYGDDNPYAPERIADGIDAERFPLTARAAGDLLGLAGDASFEQGLRIVLRGMRAVRAEEGGG